MGKIRIFQRIKPAGEDGFCRGIGSGRRGIGREREIGSLKKDRKRVKKDKKGSERVRKRTGKTNSALRPGRCFVRPQGA